MKIQDEAVFKHILMAVWVKAKTAVHKGKSHVLPFPVAWIIIMAEMGEGSYLSRDVIVVSELCISFNIGY